MTKSEIKGKVIISELEFIKQVILTAKTDNDMPDNTDFEDDPDSLEIDVFKLKQEIKK